jgi:hypothetical protein
MNARMSISPACLPVPGWSGILFLDVDYVAKREELQSCNTGAAHLG